MSSSLPSAKHEKVKRRQIWRENHTNTSVGSMLAQCIRFGGKHTRTQAQTHCLHTQSAVWRILFGHAEILVQRHLSPTPSNWTDECVPTTPIQNLLCTNYSKFQMMERSRIKSNFGYFFLQIFLPTFNQNKMNDSVIFLSLHIASALAALYNRLNL